MSTKFNNDRKLPLILQSNISLTTPYGNPVLFAREYERMKRIFAFASLLHDIVHGTDTFKRFYNEHHRSSATISANTTNG